MIQENQVFTCGVCRKPVVYLRDDDPDVVAGELEEHFCSWKCLDVAHPPDSPGDVVQPEIISSLPVGEIRPIDAADLGLSIGEMDNVNRTRGYPVC